MERMRAIDIYTDEGQRIVGKQEASIMGGNGARLVVDVPEMQEHDDKTIVEVSAEKEVPIDMATNPENIKSMFLERMNHLRKKDIDTLIEEMSEVMEPGDSKEVSNSGSFDNGNSAMGARFVITFIVMMVFTILFGVMMTSMMMP